MKKVDIYETVINQDIRRAAVEIEEVMKSAQPPLRPCVPAEVSDAMSRVMAWCVASMMKGMTARWN